jgi:phosphate transport system substrate-binding protein
MEMSGFSRLGKAVAGAALAVALVMPLAASAQDATVTPYQPSTDLGSLSGTVTADGSSTVGPITEALAEEFAGQASGVKIPVDISGTGGGFARFCAGETDLQDASRPIKDEEKVTCEAAGVNYFVFEIAYDGISIVVNPENDFVDCLTVEQLNKIWAPDSTVKTWQDVNPDWPADAISLYGPGTASGTFDYFTGAINGEEGASRTDYTPSEDDNVLVQGVAGDSGALGYFGFAYYEQNQDSLKLVSVDSGAGCTAPSKDSIRDGSYAPLSRPLFIYVNAESFTRPEVQEFMRFAIATAPGIVDEVGYVDSPVEVYVADQAKVEAIIAGTQAPDGPAAPAATPEGTPAS